ncbi:S8 family serine peptidase [Cytobacillus firmus]|uniref:S8 family peptidase n=1 Tax=Cytobacillus firmus TaxID=1399 RepID=UPI0038501644
MIILARQHIKPILILVLAFLVSFYALQGKVSAEEQESYIVFMKNNYTEKTLQDMGISVTNSFENIHAAAIKATVSQIDALEDLGITKKAIEDHPVKINAQITPWGHSNINLPAKQPSDLTGKNVKVAILDTGIDSGHPDLKVKSGICVLQKCTNSFQDDNGHGTHVAGIIGAQNNNIGIVGVAPEAEIYVIKALDKYGNGTTSTIMAGLDWAISQNVDIINMSLTSAIEDVGMKTMIDKAFEKGIIVIAAAGNTGTDIKRTEQVLYPAKFDNVIAVSGVDKDNVRVDSSSKGKEVELAAPGENIYSTYPRSIKANGYAYMTGTSMAAPFVTGLAALYKEKYPFLNNEEIRTLLQSKAKDLGAAGRDPLYGYGIAQADAEPINSIKIPYTVNSGIIKLNFEEFLGKYDGYKLLRYDQTITQNGKEAIFTDYGLKGNIEYTVIPLQGGKELRENGTTVTVTVEAPVFHDLSNSKWYSRHMMYLHSESVLLGYSGELIKPDQLVKRSEAVAMLGRALNWNSTKRETRFSDVGSKNHASGYIESAAEKEILRGFHDGTFRPDEPVTRAEMAMLISNAYSLPQTGEVAFTDVNANVTGYQSIYNLAASGITEGYADGTFRPYKGMLRSTYSVFLAKAENSKLH